MNRPSGLTPSFFEVTTCASLQPNSSIRKGGSICVAFSVRNTTTIAAIMPFLVFSALGIRLVEESNWIRESVVNHAGKRLIRFASFKEGPLEQGCAATPCVMHLDVTPNRGGAIVVSRSFKRLLNDISDIRISCTVGAGNFSPEPATVVVRGSLICDLAASLLGGQPGTQTVSSKLEISTVEMNCLASSIA